MPRPLPDPEQLAVRRRIHRIMTGTLSGDPDCPETQAAREALRRTMARLLDRADTPRRSELMAAALDRYERAVVRASRFARMPIGGDS